MTRARPRDEQRRRVYYAEHHVRELFDRADQIPGRTIEMFGSRICLPVERRMASLKSVSIYLNSVLALGWVRHRYDRATIPITVRARAGATRAHYKPATAIAADITRRLPDYETTLCQVLAPTDTVHGDRVVFDRSGDRVRGSIRVLYGGETASDSPSPAPAHSHTGSPHRSHRHLDWEQP